MVAWLYTDHGMDPDTVLDMHPSVLAAVVARIHYRAKAVAEEQARRQHEADIAAGHRMAQALGGRWN